MPTVSYPSATRRSRRTGAINKNTDIGHDSRREMGQWLRDLRLAKDMTQGEVAERCGLGGYTALSAVETGRIACPPEWLEPLCTLYGQEPEEFGKKSLWFLHPWIYGLIYGYTPKLRRRLGGRPSSDGTNGNASD